MTVITISASMLRWYTSCERRIWLDKYGDSQDRNELPGTTYFRRVQGIQHEKEILNYTMPNHENINVSDWAEAVTVTRDLMAGNTRRIAGAAFETSITLNSTPEDIRLIGQVDQLIALDDRYGVVEIKYRQRLNPSDELQMDLYVWLIEQITGRQPEAEFWLGVRQGSARYNPVPHTYDELRLMTTLERVAQLMSAKDEEPYVRTASHCEACHWHHYCSNKAKKRLSLSLLNGIRSKTIEDMRQKGYTSLRQLVKLKPDELMQFHGIKTTATRYHAQARSWVENQPIWYGEVPDNCYRDAWFFDIETNPDTGAVWSIGWSKANGRTEAIIVAPGKHGLKQTLPDGHLIHYVQNANSAWELFHDVVSADDMPIFHWSGFDAGIMKSFAPHIHENLKPRLMDLCKVFSQTVQIPQQGVSLKVVAPYLGFKWRAYEDWFQAWTDYLHWLDSGDETRLLKLSQYQTDDVLAMIVVNEWLIT